MSTKETTEYAFGIIWRGHALDQEDADKMMGEVEMHLTLEKGYTHTRGGARPFDSPLCDCEAANECDVRPGCMFTESEGS